MLVAICDTGVGPSHPDLSLVAGRNVVSNNANTRDMHFHGTFCAGMAAATGDNGIGVAGAGWTLRVMPVRITNDSLSAPPCPCAPISDQNKGSRWAVDHGARIINVSFGGTDDPSVGTTGTYIRNHGGLLFRIAGNDAKQISGGDHADVVVVGATDQSDNRASFSNWGNFIDVVAPGDLRSCEQHEWLRLRLRNKLFVSARSGGRSHDLGR